MRTDRSEATVSRQGEITIPQALRVRLDIQPGDILELYENDGLLIATKQRPRDSVDDVYGILELDRSVAEIVDDLRGGDSRSGS